MRRTVTHLQRYYITSLLCIPTSLRVICLLQDCPALVHELQPLCYLSILAVTPLSVCNASPLSHLFVYPHSRCMQYHTLPTAECYLSYLCVIHLPCVINPPSHF